MSGLMKEIALVLFLFLTLQLTGLTCIQDLGAYFIPGGSTTVSALKNHASLEESSKASSVPSQQPLQHDCPCHHVVTYLSGTTLGAFLYSGELAMPVSTSVRDNFPQAIFLPPRFLL